MPDKGVPDSAITDPADEDPIAGWLQAASGERYSMRRLDSRPGLKAGMRTRSARLRMAQVTRVGASKPGTSRL